MAEVTALLVKALRDKSGAGMMDCKHALIENSCDMDASVDWLRKKGLAAAAKKAGRIAAEGLVAVAVEGNRGAIVEVNSETDFVARNPEFQSFVGQIASTALRFGGDYHKTLTAEMGADNSVEAAVTSMVGAIGEHLNFRRAQGVSVNEGIVASYVHSPTAPDMGRIGVLVGLESIADEAKLLALGKQLAMHVAASNPLWVAQSDVDSKAIDREREVLSAQARDSGKPEEIVSKMVDGRMRKYFEEVCLLEQIFVIDGEAKVAEALAAAELDVGAPIKITGFARVHIGEGVEREDTDFATEVAATAAS
ncbi:MAG: translation elongation factor Ts [Pseudomonadota bacterium]|nr:translation elongation factor Ts [Pseudomonadota bacterium]